MTISLLINIKINDNYCWHFHILAEKSSCSAEMSMETFITSGPGKYTLGVEGGGGGNLGIILERVCEPVFRNLLIYLAFEKNGPIHIPDHLK